MTDPAPTPKVPTPARRTRSRSPTAGICVAQPRRGGEKTVIAHRGDLIEPDPDTDASAPSATTPARNNREPTNDPYP